MSDPLLSLVVPAPRRTGRGALAGLLLVGALAVVAVARVGIGGAVEAAGVAGAVRPLAAEVAAVAPAPADRAPAPVGAPPSEPSEQAPLGVAQGLRLSVPAVDPVVVSYHEASYGEALPIAPAGSEAGNDNPTRSFDRLGGDGPPYLVQVSRGRVQGPTTAVDVAIRGGDPVLAPVAGTVTEVLPYRLYGTHEDVRLELRPDDRPELRVVLIHVEDVAVAAGDRVAVGDVLAGGARAFPFEAVVDRSFAPERHGHVHLEVKRPAPDG